MTFCVEKYITVKIVPAFKTIMLVFKQHSRFIFVIFLCVEQIFHFISADKADCESDLYWQETYSLSSVKYYNYSMLFMHHEYMFSILFLAKRVIEPNKN